MQFTISPCNSEQYPELVKALDKEFVFDKKRIISLATRYPKALSIENLNNIFIASTGRNICSVVVIKRFVLLINGNILNGAMIGMVYTLPQYRHLGLASNLLDTIGNKLKKEGTDFAVLWTKINDFYKRLGWYQQDNGIFGEFSKPTTTKVIKSNNLIESVQLKTADFNSLESIRMQYLDVRILRTGLDYQVIPIPTNSVDLYLFELHNKCSGYALIGRLSETGYLYEVVGDPGSYEGLWTSISSNYDNLYINSSLDSEFTKWLGDVTNFNWKLQNLTMWLKLSENANRLLKLETYIPFFDRI